MSKRSATAEAQGASPAKSPHIEGVESSYIDDGDDDFTSVQSPSSMADAESTGTGATTPRTKFPSDLKTVACTWPGCPKTFNRPARLRDHLNSHTKSRPFKCTYEGCDKDYIEDKHLKQHVKAVHTHDRRYVCQREGCGKRFVTGTRLKRHQLVHEGADRFRCPDCGESFRKKETLHRHVRKEHMDAPAHECPEPGCTEAFNTKPALKRHHDKMHGEIKFWCDECRPRTAGDGPEHRVGFTTEFLLLEHLKQEHQNCIFCEYKSPSRCELEKHIEMHHSGKTVEDRKTHACTHDGCHKRFTKKSNLRVHIRSAHQGFRFVCGEVALSGLDLEGWTNELGCGDKFSTKVRLQDHVRFKHLGQPRPRLSRPESPKADLIDDISGVANRAKQTIPCPHCPATFIRYYDLDVHLDRDHGSAAAQPAAVQDCAPSAWPEAAPHEELFAADMGYGLPRDDWPEDEDLAHEEMFAAQMEYGPPRDDWPEDEANILLLAREPSGALDPDMDPALAGA